MSSFNASYMISFSISSPRYLISIASSLTNVTSYAGPRANLTSDRSTYSSSADSKPSGLLTLFGSFAIAFLSNGLKVESGCLSLL